MVNHCLPLHRSESPRRVTALSLFALTLLTAAIGASAQTREERTEYETASGTTGFRRRVTREESGNRTLETWVVETPSFNGAYGALLEVQEETVRIDDRSTRVTRREFATDGNGRSTPVATIEEQRVESPDGDISVSRDVLQTDINGRTQLSRRETETTSEASDGTYQKVVQVSRGSINRSGLAPTEQVVETGRRDSDGRTLESDRTTYADPTQRGDWQPLEREIASYDYGGGEVSTARDVYRRDANGDLALREQVVSRQWTDEAGRERTSEDTYSTDIPGERSLREPGLLRQVSVTRTERPDGGWNLTREVRESRQGRFRLVERETETGQPNRSGGTDVEHLVERLDANGRVEPVETSTSTSASPDR